MKTVALINIGRYVDAFELLQGVEKKVETLASLMDRRFYHQLCSFALMFLGDIPRAKKHCKKALEISEKMCQNRLTVVWKANILIQLAQL